MGIKSLAKVIMDHAPQSIRKKPVRRIAGRKIAMDSTLMQYQFLQSKGSPVTNEAGQITSHLMGMFFRSIRMCETGIKPLFVFEGKAPAMKSWVLDGRRERREGAQREMDAAREAGDGAAYNRASKKMVRVTHVHNDDCKQLLDLMGIPFMDVSRLKSNSMYFDLLDTANAPGEAEAQCAELVKAGKAYATGTEDMDALTFGSGVLVRNLNPSSSCIVSEYHLEEVLMDMNLNKTEFVDLCILLGCDYCDSIKNVGPKRAMELIQQYRNIETILANIDQTKYSPPADWDYQAARLLFYEPNVDPNTAELTFEWTEPDVDGVVKYMVGQKGFSLGQINRGVQKLKRCNMSYGNWNPERRAHARAVRQADQLQADIR